MYACACVCMHVCIYECMFLCMYVCMYVCMLCMYVCMLYVVCVRRCTVLGKIMVRCSEVTPVTLCLLCAGDSSGTEPIGAVCVHVATAMQCSTYIPSPTCVVYMSVLQDMLNMCLLFNFHTFQINCRL